jgi:hypothetical protein
LSAEECDRNKREVMNGMDLYCLFSLKVMLDTGLNTRAVSMVGVAEAGDAVAVGEVMVAIRTTAENIKTMAIMMSMLMIPALLEQVND